MRELDDNTFCNLSRLIVLKIIVFWIMFDNVVNVCQCVLVYVNVY